MEVPWCLRHAVGGFIFVVLELEWMEQRIADVKREKMREEKD